MSALEIDEYLSVLVGDEGYEGLIPEKVSVDFII